MSESEESKVKAHAELMGKRNAEAPRKVNRFNRETCVTELKRLGRSGQHESAYAGKVLERAQVLGVAQYHRY